MGVLGGRDAFSSKYVTAMIFDEENRMHLIPITHPLDNYFIAKINGESYVFRIVHSRIKMWYTKFTKSFRVLLYTTKHYMPISPENNKGLELLLQDNALPKMNKMLYNVLSVLGKTEKKDFVAHDLEELVTEVSEREDLHAENVRNIKTFLDDLNVKQIITPVRDITDFIYEDLIATDPQFLGSIPERVMEAEIENRKVTNSPIGAKHAWMKWIAVFAIVALVGVGVYMLATSGNISAPNFGGFLPSMPSMTGGPSDAELMRQYPTPESMKVAINEGRLDYNSLSSTMKKMVDTVKLPTVTPKDHSVVIGQ